MGLEAAKREASRSPDPYMKVGCAALNTHGSIMACGHNSLAGDIPDTDEIWKDRAGRRRFMVHAEINMLKYMSYKVDIATIVTTLFPCEACMLALASRNVKTICYMDIYTKDFKALEIAAFYKIDCVQLSGGKRLISPKK